MLDLLENAPDRASAICLDHEKITYFELKKKVDDLCKKLQSQGMREGDRVCFTAHISIDCIITFLSLAKMGACACPLSFRLPESSKSTHIAQIRPDYLLDIEKHQIQKTPFQTKRQESIFTLIATSGSSGVPKIAAHSRENYLYSAKGSNDPLAITNECRYLISLPLHHVGGICAMMRAIIAQGTLILSKRPLNEALENEKVSHVSLVPTQLYRLVHKEKMLLPKELKRILIGGAALPQRLWKEALEKDFPIVTSYGMTEMSSQITMLQPKDKHTPLSYGKPLEHREIKISDKKEIYVRGKTLFLGYLSSDTDKLIRPLKDGWFATNDMGYMDASGNLHIRGRKDSMFISGGENIHPETIENALCSLDGICEAIVVPIPDVEYGQRPVAFIEADGKINDMNKLKNQLKNFLPSFAIPVRFYSLPQNHSGLKTSRKALELKALSDILL